MKFADVRKYVTGLLSASFVNKNILDNLAEDENANLTYKGAAIEGGGGGGSVEIPKNIVLYAENSEVIDLPTATPITIDEELNETSTNPVQNKVITSKLNEISQSISGSGESSVNYSTDEQVIGTWIDGKILYQKTYACGTIGNNQTTYTPLNITSLEKIISIRGIAISINDNKIVRPLPQVDNTSLSNCIRVDSDGSNLRTLVTGNWETYEAYITIEYTKTVD